MKPASNLPNSKQFGTKNAVVREQRLHQKVANLFKPDCERARGNRFRQSHRLGLSVETRTQRASQHRKRPRSASKQALLDLSIFCGKPQVPSSRWTMAYYRSPNPQSLPQSYLNAVIVSRSNFPSQSQCHTSNSYLLPSKSPLC